jgi:hypothetical protein
MEVKAAFSHTIFISGVELYEHKIGLYFQNNCGVVCVVADG